MNKIILATALALATTTSSFAMQVPSLGFGWDDQTPPVAPQHPVVPQQVPQNDDDDTGSSEEEKR